MASVTWDSVAFSAGRDLALLPKGAILFLEKLEIFIEQQSNESKNRSREYISAQARALLKNSNLKNWIIDPF